MWLAFRPILTWIFSTTVIKGVVLTLLAVLVASLFDWLWSIFPSWATPQALNDWLEAIPSGMWWFLDFTNINYGLPLIISAVFIRFLIRRMPLVG